MRSRAYRVLRFSSALLVLSGYLALASVDSYGVPLLLIPVLLFAITPIGESLDRQTRYFRVLSRGVSIIYCSFLPMTVLVLGLMNGVLLLVMYIQAYTLLHRKAERNYLHLYLMAFFMLLAACVQAPNPAIGPVMVLFLLSAIWALLSLRIHVETLQEQAAMVPDLVPLHQDAPRATDTPRDPFNIGLVFTVSSLSAAAILLTTMTFLFTPRIEAGFLGRRNLNIAETGISETVDLMGGTNVEADPTPVMHVEFPEEPEGRYDDEESLYWRITTLPYYRDNSWSRAPLHHHLEPIDHKRPFFDRAEQDDPTDLAREGMEDVRVVLQQVYMDNVPEQGVPCLDLVRRVKADALGDRASLTWDRNLDFTVELRMRGERRLEYAVESEVRVRDEAALRNARQDYDFLMHPDDYRLLTYHELMPQTVALTEDLTESLDNPYDKALAVQAYLGGPDFLYSLSVPPMPPDFLIDTFINVSKIGHCEFYASAMALMLRSLDIPARVVSGYRGGEWDEADGAYTVRGSMAHLWVEVWFPGQGWTVFDPSPAGVLQPQGLDAVRAAISRTMLRARMFWYREVVGFEGRVRLDVLRDRSLAFIRGFLEEDGTNAAPVHRSHLPLLVLVMLTVSALALALLFWRRRWRRRSPWKLSPDQQRAVRVYRGLRRRLAKDGIPCDGYTAEELAGVLRAAGTPGADTGEGLIALYNEVRFGGRPLTDHRFAQALRQLRALKRSH